MAACTEQEGHPAINTVAQQHVRNKCDQPSFFSTHTLSVDTHMRMSRTAALRLPTRKSVWPLNRIDRDHPSNTAPALAAAMHCSAMGSLSDSVARTRRTVSQNAGKVSKSALPLSSKTNESGGFVCGGGGSTLFSSVKRARCSMLRATLSSRDKALLQSTQPHETERFGVQTLAFFLD